MAQGQGLETKPGAKFVITHTAHQKKVFVTHAVHSLTVDTGFVGEDHTGQEGVGVEILAYVLRALVDAQEEAHAVAGSVAEVTARPPQRLTRQGVYLAARGSSRETSISSGVQGPRGTVRVISVVPKRYCPPESTRYRPRASRRDEPSAGVM